MAPITTTSNYLNAQLQKPAMKAALQLNAAADNNHNNFSKKSDVGCSVLSRRYEELLSAKKYTDCIFYVNDDEIKCHKIILSAASPVFEAMLYGSFLEHEKNAVEIDDINASVFRVLIAYIYTGNVKYEELNLEGVIELFYAAEKYLLDELVNECLRNIGRKLRFTNILPALELSVCMNFANLLDVCMTFFLRCCVNNNQYMNYLKEHYVHVTKDCVKAIIAACKAPPHKLPQWYVYEWIQQECQLLGNTVAQSPNETPAVVLKELQLDAQIWLQQSGEEGEPKEESTTTVARCSIEKPRPKSIVVVAERNYFKACRPYTVDADDHLWRTHLRTERFISLQGFILNSRLTPNYTSVHWCAPNEYDESLRLELIIISTAPNNNQQQQQQQQRNNDFNLVWSIAIKDQKTKYNSDLRISWSEDVILAPDVFYELRLYWDSNAYGSEYPCSLQSNVVDGIKFFDLDCLGGSLVKGLQYINLV